MLFRSLERQKLHHGGLLSTDAQELHVDDADGGDLAADEAGDVLRGEILDRGVGGLVTELGVVTGDLVASEAEEALSLLADDLDLAALEGGVLADELGEGSEDAAVVGAAQAAVGGDDEREGLAGALSGKQEGVRDVGAE